MASSLGFTDLNTYENNNDNRKNRKRNKTYKNKPKLDKQKIETFLNSIENNGDIDDNDEGLANFEPLDFNPPQLPQLTKQPDIKENNIQYNNIIPNEDNKTKDMNNMVQQYNDYIPYYTNASSNRNIHGSKDILLTKLNYMIHLLEENKDERTNNIAEELILYGFLGVFMIFIVDSFTRASHTYKR